MSLSDKQNEAIDLLIIGNMTKIQIADSIKVAEKTIYNWLNNNEEFRESLQKRTDIFNSTKIIDAKNKLATHLDMAIANIVEMAEDKTNPKRFECNKYLVDRSLGAVTTKVEQSISENKDDNKNVGNMADMLSKLPKDTSIEED